MKNTKFKTKLIARAILVVIILSTILTTGCQFFTPNETTENSQKEVINHEPQDLINGLIAKMQAAGYEEMKFTAEYFYFEPIFHEYCYSLSIKIVDNHFLINGIIYDDISYSNNYLPTFQALNLPHALELHPEKYEVLLKIQETNSCYVLKTEDEEHSYFGNPILVYEIDGDYYFLGCYYEKTVVTVNKATIK